MNSNPQRLAHRLKRLLHTGTLAYQDGVPDHPGKLRLMRLLDTVVGPALYEVDGLKLLLSPHRLIDNYIIRQGSYGPELVAFIQQAMRGGGAFIDVGANIGYLSLQAARANGARSRVYAFEPSPREYAYLLHHIVLNQLMNVVPFPVGIGSIDQSSTLWLAGVQNPGQNSRFVREGAVADVEIALAPIDSLLPLKAIAEVRCVKIDVEGDECSVLAGFARVMPSLRQASFLVEISPDLLLRAGHSTDAVYDFFSHHGFRSCRGARPALAQWDEVFVAADAPNPPALWF